MRTANFCEPKTFTCATPGRLEMRWASMVSAYSSTCCSGKVGELSARNRIGESDGLTLRMVGGFGISAGSLRRLPAIADCTSWAAPSILRSRANCRVMRVTPWLLVEVIESTPAMVENWFSSGLATAEAMVSGSAPGRVAVTAMVGKSTLGSSLTGSCE